MSGTRSRDAGAAGAPGGAPSRFPTVAIDIGVLLAGLTLFALMLLLPAYQAIPYHLLYLLIIIVYGYRVWPLAPTILVVATIFLATGLVEVLSFIAVNTEDVGITVGHGGHGGDHVGELFEVFLMPAILVAMIWSVRRRDAAERHMHEVAVRESDMRQAETQFLLDAAHALRNPLAVANGWLDLADDGASPREAATLDRVRGELARIDRIARGLLDVAAQPDASIGRAVPVDLCVMAAEAVERWSGTADRRWLLDTRGSLMAEVDPDRVVDALDAVIDNALRFTRDGDTVRVMAVPAGSRVMLAVADSGPGIPLESRLRVFDRFWRSPAPDGSASTGLGLALVAVVSEQYGGRAFVSGAPEGGALVGMQLPHWVAPVTDDASAPVNAVTVA